MKRKLILGLSLLLGCRSGSGSNWCWQRAGRPSTFGVLLLLAVVGPVMLFNDIIKIPECAGKITAHSGNNNEPFAAG